MAAIRRSVSASATWLLKTVADMAATLERRVGSNLVDRKIVDGYLLIAKKTQGLPNKPGLASHMQPAQVKNSIRLTALAMDLPAFVCLPGRYIVGGTFDPDKSYVHTLQAGRDSYIPKTLTSMLDAQTDPLTLAGPYRDIALGSRSITGNRVATRFWGVAQPFNGVGCMYGYGAVYLTPPSKRWALAWAKTGDTFVYRMVVQTPSYLRYVTAKGVEAMVPETPSALPSGWTLEISEVAIGFGAVAFTRFEGEDPTYGLGANSGAEANWETAEYPWFSFSTPRTFIGEDGAQGYKVVVAAQAVYEYGGPYTQHDPSMTNGWGETDFGSPAGGRGLWIAELQVISGKASILHQYKLYGGDSSDERRAPRLLDLRGSGNAFSERWYLDNVVYKAAPAVLDTGHALMVSVSFVDRANPADGLRYGMPEPWLFVDVSWFYDGAQHTQNVTTTQLSRNFFSLDESGIEVETWYVGYLTRFNAGSNENRFALGAATDGKIMVAPIFSSFRPGEMPRLQVIVADKDSAVTAYSGTPGFAMSMGFSLDEVVAVQHKDHPVGEYLATETPLRYWTIPAGDGQVSYIGNGKFMFYISTEWTTPSVDDLTFTPSANLAVAIYDNALKTVGVAGIVYADLISSGIPPGSIALTQVYWSARPGRIEVVRPESDGYKPAGTGVAEVGHPATLIVSVGCGLPADTLQGYENQDIKSGITWISYDSGTTWVPILSYGSPAGAFHCGNIAQARSEPVVRI